MRYLLWIPAVLVGWTLIQAKGLPHLRAHYVFSAKSYDPLAERDYHECTYLGPYGSFRIVPSDGQCALFVWRRRAI